MQKVIITKGLPASGKDDWAKLQMANNPDKYKRINKDDIRAMLDLSVWNWRNEKFVLDVRNKMILGALRGGWDVLVTDTNLNPKMEIGIRNLVGDRAIVEVIHFDVDADTCIARNKARQNRPDEVAVPDGVIEKMAKQWEAWRHVDCSVKQLPHEKYEWELGLSTAIMCDIDGTLAHMHNRSPYDWHKVLNDKLDEAVAIHLHAMKDAGNDIVIMSGRDSVCRRDTQEWLSFYNIPYDGLFMRPEADMRKDNIVKRELFNQFVRPNWNILYVLDDRQQVVDEWRSMGLTCFQVDEGDF